MLEFASSGELLRILCGIWFLPHIYGKITNFDKATETFVASGLKPGRVFIVLTLVLECLAVIGMVFNIYPGLATACAVIVLLGATYSVAVRNESFSWRWQKMGPEFPFFWALACIISAL